MPSTAPGFPATLIANFAGLTKRFLVENQWFKWSPDVSIIERGTGENESLKTAVISDSGDFLAVYFSNNSPAKVRNKLKKEAAANWFDPRNGKTESAGNFAANEARDLIPPDGWEDAILILK